MVVGATIKSNLHFKGQIDEICVFGRALSANEIYDMYRMGSP